MRRPSQTIWTLSFASTLVLVGGCFTDVGSGTSASTSEDSSSTTAQGDGDGDPAGDGDQSGDGDGDAPGDGDGDSGTDSEGTACGAGSACLPEPGAAWMGPFAVAEMMQGCGGEFPAAAFDLFETLDVAPASCECSCGVPEVQCSTDMSVVGYAQINCVSGQGANSIDENQCYNTFSASHGVSLDPASSSCADGQVDSMMPAPNLANAVVACGGAQSSGVCDMGEVCVPAPGAGFDGGVCYASEGDVTCPAGYPDKFVYFSDVLDERSCPNSCSCTGAGAVCSVSVTGFALPNCGSPQGAASTDSGSEVCAALNSNAVQSIRPGNVTVDEVGICLAQPLQPSGGLMAIDPITLCCTG